jgi:spermidine synthase
VIITKEQPDGTSPYMPILLALFFASGCAALIYEIVWYQLLQLSVGSTAVSLGMLLASFMGGLCIGSLALPRLLPMLPLYWQHPLRTFALIEFCIALFGIAELVIIPALEHLYLAGAPGGFAGSILRGTVAAACLLPPTIFMGASLPAIARWCESTPRGAARWALLYGAKTAGAVAGCLQAGFYILRLYDVYVASFSAASINAAAALAAFALALFAAAPRGTHISAEKVAPDTTSAGDRLSVYFTVGLSGACALGAEVVWTRLMGLMFGATVYAFSIILAVFLVGLAIGTNIGSKLGRDFEPRAALGWSQILAAMGMAWTAYCVAVAMPYWPIDPTLSPGPLTTFELDLARSAIALLPPTVAWGASLSLAFAVLVSNKKDPGRTVGSVYAANTFGAIVGALASSLVLIPLIGTQKTQQVMILLAGLSALVAFAPWRNLTRDAWSIVTGVAVVAMLIVSVQNVPGELIAYGRRVASNHGKSEILFTGEGRNTSIAVSRWISDGTVQFHVAGKVEASTLPADMKLQRMLGHVAGLLHPNPQSVLIVGFGAGVTAGSFTQYDSIKRIAICELEPLIPPTTTKYFGRQNYNVMNDKRTQITYDDARHYVAKTKEKFDVITSDPIHPFVKGSAALYSKEYFEMLRDHLNPGGIVTQWIPLYESDERTVKSEIATFMQAFPYATIYANLLDGGGYDLVLVGQKEAPKVDVDAIQARLASQGFQRVRTSLADVGINSAADLLSTYSGDKPGLAPWLRNAEINHDNDMRLQYLAGLSLNVSQEGSIFQHIVSYRKLPRDSFTGSPSVISNLFSRMTYGGQEE